MMCNTTVQASRRRSMQFHSTRWSKLVDDKKQANVNPKPVARDIDDMIYGDTKIQPSNR